MAGCFVPEPFLTVLTGYRGLNLCALDPGVLLDFSDTGMCQIALAGMAISPWIVWAAIIGVLLILQQSVARIEKRLDAMENR